MTCRSSFGFPESIMAAESEEKCVDKLKKLWGDVVSKERFVCEDCFKKNPKYKSLTFSYYAVCLIDDHVTSQQYYVVSKKDLEEQHRAVQGDTTASLNPVSVTECI